MDPLKLGLVSKTYFYVPVWAGLGQGIFEREGLNVTTSLLGNAPQAAPLASGDLDVVIGTPEGVLQNAAAGGPLRIIAGNTGKLSHFVIAQSRFKRIEDLRGARIGILGLTEGTFFHVKTVLAAHGLHFPENYRVIETGGAPPRHKALIEDKIDMGLQSVPLVYAEEDLGFSNLGEVSRYVPHWQFNTVNVSIDRALVKRDVIRRFLRAMRAATEWTHTHREEAADIAVREMDIERKYALRGWDYYIGNNVITRDLSISEPGMQALIETLASAGLLPPAASRRAQTYIDSGFD